MKAYSYIRFSSDKQQWGDSERRQEQKSKDWCAQRNIELANIYADRGISGWKGKNRKEGAFSELLKVLKAGDYILIEDNDRFSREDALTAMQALKDICLQGITVVFLRTGIEVNKTNFNDPAILIPNFLQAYLGNQENEKKSEGISKAWATKKKAAANHVVLGNCAPAWLDVDKEKNSIKPNKRAETVNAFFESFAAGKGIRTIVKELNGEKVSAFGKGAQDKGNGWSSTHLRRILMSRSVIGEYQPHIYVSKIKRIPEGPPIPDYYPRIVSNELFYKCQEILARNKGAGGAKTNGTNLFTGLCKCAHCGGSMIVKQSPAKRGKYFYTLLRCYNAVRHAGCTHKSTIQLRHVERAVLSVLWSKVIPGMTEENARENKLTGCRGELLNADKQIERLTNALATGAMPKSVINKIAELETQRKGLNSEIEKLESLAQENPLKNWEQVAPTIENRLRMQNLLRGEIESLKIDAGGRTATLSLTDPAMTFELAWNYQKANQVNANPADSGFILSGAGFDKAPTVYTDEVFVWKTKNTPPMAKVLRLPVTLNSDKERRALSIAS
jgi:DNA invertase Pin-like site-specific DNA recombinase